MVDDTKVIRVGDVAYSVRPLDPGDMFDLFEACSEMSNNRAWVGYASRVCSVRDIDGVPVPFPRTKEDVKALARRIGNVAMDALLDEANNDTVDGVDLTIAKN
jgi:hypothetical protein